MAEYLCDSCLTVIDYEPWPNPFEEGFVCTECLYELQDENEEADEQADE